MPSELDRRLLAAGALQFTIYDVGARPPVWDRGYAGVELFGIWLFCMSAVVVPQACRCSSSMPWARARRGSFRPR